MPNRYYVFDVVRFAGVTAGLQAVPAV